MQAAVEDNATQHEWLPWWAPPWRKAGPGVSSDRKKPGLVISSMSGTKRQRPISENLCWSLHRVCHFKLEGQEMREDQGA